VATKLTGCGVAITIKKGGYMPKKADNQGSQVAESYLKNLVFLVSEYELIKEKKHAGFTSVEAFFQFHKINRQTFLKYYHRYKENLDTNSLLPRKRGPKFMSRRPDIEIEKAVVKYRKKGYNKHEIHEKLKPKYEDKTPSPSGCYNIFLRYNVNVLTPQAKEKKRNLKSKRKWKKISKRKV
jgi:hypothetical protein